jgi:MFS family permease
MIMVAVGLWVRLRVSESPVFTEAVGRQELVRAPLVAVFRQYPGRIVTGMLAALGGLTTWFLITTFSVSYGTTELGIPSQTMVLIACVTAATHGVLVIPAALVVERFGRRIPMTAGAVGLAVFVVPAFALLATADPLLIGLGFCLTMIPFTLIFGPVGAWLAELFPTHVRYVGASTGFMLASLFGGFAPLIGSALLADGRAPLLLGLYAGGLAVLGALALAFSPETKH